VKTKDDYATIDMFAPSEPAVIHQFKEVSLPRYKTASSLEKYRHECEVKWITFQYTRLGYGWLSDYLATVEKRRGAQAAKKLYQEVLGEDL